MMQYVDGVSRYVDSLVYRYIINASPLHSEDIVTRPFVYSFDVFIRYNTPRHVTVSNKIFISVTTLRIPYISTIFHIPIKLSTVFNFGSIPIISNLDSDCHG